MGEKGENDEYGISAKEAYSLLDVAKMFGGDIEMTPQTKLTRSTVVADTTKLNAIGWKQEHTLAQYIQEVKKEKDNI